MMPVFKVHTSPQQMVHEFMEAMGQDINKPFTDDLVSFRWDLITEELDEVSSELLDPYNVEDIDRKKLTKELADLLYVVYGAAVTFGLPLEEVFEEVHRSNMSKLGDDGKPIYREDGKVLKGENYTPPNLDKFFKE